MNDKYILNAAGDPEPCPDLIKWATWFNEPKLRIVRQTEVGRLLVSTVFLGIDHSFGRGGAPLLWETMILEPVVDTEGGRAGLRDHACERYSSREAAELAHDRLVADAEILSATLPPLEAVRPLREVVAEIRSREHYEPDEGTVAIIPVYDTDEPDAPDDGAAALELERQTDADLEDSD